MGMYRLLLLWVVSLLLLWSCSREKASYSTDAVVALGIDSLHFDTLFTQYGSKTFRFRIYNTNRHRIRLSAVWLAGGSSSIFHINVNGQQGPEVRNIEINANDSATVFVNAFIEPSAGRQPFVINDSIGVQVNGFTQWVQLEAWAQNAHYLKNAVIGSDVTWKNDLPYVVIGPLLVTKNATLTIEKGVKIYCHADGAVQINGSLQALGEAGSGRIIFTGDRLDPPYSEYPASWPGIRFLADSRQNFLQYVSIGNAYRAIVSSIPLTSAPSLVLEQVEISNALDAGLLSTHTNISATNSVIFNCGRNIRCYQGGTYEFIHCTIVTFNNNFFPHNEPVVALTDNMPDVSPAVTAPLSAIFTNCIVWGDSELVKDELTVNKKGTDTFLIRFDNGILKMQSTQANFQSEGSLTNTDPLFRSTGKMGQAVDLHLQQSSPAIGLGRATGTTIDLDGHPRLQNNSAAGAFEKQ